MTMAHDHEQGEGVDMSRTLDENSDSNILKNMELTEKVNSSPTANSIVRRSTRVRRKKKFHDEVYEMEEDDNDKDYICPGEEKNALKNAYNSKHMEQGVKVQPPRKKLEMGETLRKSNGKKGQTRECQKKKSEYDFILGCSSPRTTSKNVNPKAAQINLEGARKAKKNTTALYRKSGAHNLRNNENTIKTSSENCTKEYDHPPKPNKPESKDYMEETEKEKSEISCEVPMESDIAKIKEETNFDNTQEDAAHVEEGTKKVKCTKPPILCPYCEFKGRLQGHTVRHILAEHSNRIKQGNHYKKFQCRYCNLFFRGLENLNKHLAVVHRDEPDNNVKGMLDPSKPHLCPNKGCAHAYNAENSLQRHLHFCRFKPAKGSEEGNDTERKNPLRRKLLNRKRTNKHVLSSENHKHSIVSKCHAQCQKMAEDKVAFSCSICNKAFRHHSALVYHEALTHSKKSLRLQCDHCDEGEFSSYWQLYRHLKLNHGVSIGGGVCQICGKEFMSPGYVQIHLDTVHLKIKRFSCEVCGNAYSHRNVLYTHYADVHSDHPVYGIHAQKKTCLKCGKKFKSKGGLQAHMRRHILETTPHLLKKFECDVCPKTFYTKGHLANHKVTHTGHKRFSCPFCHKSFGTQATLYNHLYRYKAHGEMPKIKGYGTTNQYVPLGKVNFYPDDLQIDVSTKRSRKQFKNRKTQMETDGIPSTDIDGHETKTLEIPQTIKIKISEEGLGQIISNSITTLSVPSKNMPIVSNVVANEDVETGQHVLKEHRDSSVKNVNSEDIPNVSNVLKNDNFENQIKDKKVTDDKCDDKNGASTCPTETENDEKLPEMDMNTVELDAPVQELVLPECESIDQIEECTEAEPEYHLLEDYGTMETVVTEGVVEEALEMTGEDETTIVVVNPTSDFSVEEPLQIQLSGFDTFPGNTIIVAFPSNSSG